VVAGTTKNCKKTNSGSEKKNKSVRDDFTSSKTLSISPDPSQIKNGQTHSQDISASNINKPSIDYYDVVTVMQHHEAMRSVLFRE
jgi:hypothetical protein